MAAVTLKKLTKYFGRFKAIDNMDLAISDGEFFTLLGPSGCGKTTTMRIVAGFIDPDEGDVFFGDRRINSVRTHLRNTGMVFQGRWGRDILI
jgi:iron(III) transport system ATP-binding protein